MQLAKRARPQRARRGETTGPPDFVGVGAQKSGTTWWYSLIELHPQVVTRRTPKELHYFDRHLRTMPAYERYFPRPAGSVCGEWTPRYGIDDRWMAELHAQAPDARLLVALRDPVERYVAGFTMLAGQMGMARDAAMMGSEERGRYGKLLDRALALYPRERILVLQYECMVTDTLRELHRTYEFLGLPPFDPPISALRLRLNPAKVPKLELSAERRAELVARYEPEVRRVLELVPDLRVERWPNFAHLAR